MAAAAESPLLKLAAGENYDCHVRVYRQSVQGQRPTNWKYHTANSVKGRQSGKKKRQIFGFF